MDYFLGRYPPVSKAADLQGLRVNYVDSVESGREFLAWLEVALLNPGGIAVDTETHGLTWWTDDFTRLIQFGNRDEGWAVGVREWRALAERACQMVADARCWVIFHNAPFDMHALEDDGFAVPDWSRVHDTKVMHHLLWPHYIHSLKPIAEGKWGPAATIGDKLMKKKAAEMGCDWWELPTDCPEYWGYGVMDTILTRRLCDDVAPEVMRLYGPQYEREMAAEAIAFRAEKRGMRVDLDYTQRLKDQWAVEAVTLARTLEDAGIKNPLSNQQVEKTLRELDWEPDEFTPKGAAKLDKVVLKQLERAYPGIATPLMRYKRITKWSTVYLDKFLSQADKNDHVHASINTLQARTGRMSVTGPPLQTLPSKDPAIRTCILPDEGQVIYTVDYQGQEAREFVNDAQDHTMADVILNGGDLYTYFAQIVFNDPTINKDSPLRGMFKVMVLAFFYGAGVKRLALITDQSEAEVYEQLKMLFFHFPSVAEMTGNKAIGGSNAGKFARIAGERLAAEGLAYIHTTGGRRFSMESDALYKAVNGRMQGSGADCLKDAMIRLDAAGFADNIIIMVHDEVIFQFPEGDAGFAAATEAGKIMEDHSFYVPLTTEMKGPLTDWGASYR